MAVSLIVVIMLSAGVFGGVVNVALSGDEPTRRTWLWNIIAGVGAAFLTPLFLTTVSSTLLTNIVTEGKPADWFTFVGFCLLSAIASRKFIQSLTDKVLSDLKDVKHTQQQVRAELGRTDEKASQALMNSEAAQDSARYNLAPMAAGAPKTMLGPGPMPSFPDVEPGPFHDDPWAGQFGGRATANGRRIVAELAMMPARPGLATVRLTVESTDPARPLSGAVQFFLHPTFTNSQPVVPVDGGIATLTLVSWGAFTVGALADGGDTKLELDLAQHPQAQEPWRSR